MRRSREGRPSWLKWRPRAAVFPEHAERFGLIVDRTPPSRGSAWAGLNERDTLCTRLRPAPTRPLRDEDALVEPRVTRVSGLEPRRGAEILGSP